VLKARKPSALVGDPLAWWEKYVRGAHIPTLVIHTRHIRKLAGLLDLHKDPFDRILVAQALVEGVTLVTRDALLARYGVPGGLAITGRTADAK
jgi:PIN domain nuclease of toxin-antitoxin system